jgi:hypothetical protein
MAFAAADVHQTGNNRSTRPCVNGKPESLNHVAKARIHCSRHWIKEGSLTLRPLVIFLGSADTAPLGGRVDLGH